MKLKYVGLQFSRRDLHCVAGQVVDMPEDKAEELLREFPDLFAKYIDKPKANYVKKRVKRKAKRKS